MAQITYRGNLSAKVFPLLSSQQARTVIIPGYDNNYNRNLNAGSTQDSDRDVGIPQPYYLHNVMPTDRGLASVGYAQATLALTGATEKTFAGIFPALAPDGAATYILALQDGTSTYLYGLLATAELAWQWVLLEGGTITGIGTVTNTTCQGITYFYIAKIGCYKLDTSTAPATYAYKATAVTLTGLTAASLLGIVSYGGYLVAWTATEVPWSSSIDPTDFTPSLATGAGGGSIEAVRGSIVACVANAVGFYVMTTQNAVIGVFSNNARYPFNFREISSAGGLTDINYVAQGDVALNTYVYTTSGLQAFSTTAGSQAMFPMVTDFISGNIYEDFNEDTGEVQVFTLGSPIKKRISYVSDRYLIISYGSDTYNYALIYDSAQQRWGKLKHDHVGIIAWNLYAPDVTDVANASIGLVQADGQVVVASVGELSGQGVLILGKFQYSRQAMLQLHQCDLENAANVNVTALVSIDGKNTRQVLGTPGNQFGALAVNYFKGCVGTNVSLVIKGSFDLNTVVLRMSLHGRRGA